ncbi:AMP-binding protein [Bradyrhizobium sp. 195]|uniref:AMP-binding protein n=1 Tax=Bradyrhizobium sp. 195 TaxID=2782662 RepID=UPI0020019307|nr:AMP-binding protein [Bradyrhizobium sp. 195]UPK29961.1 AMP-binding protein [Bradyrhizobium sp. 195]
MGAATVGRERCSSDRLAGWNERLLTDYLDLVADESGDDIAIVHHWYRDGARLTLTFADLRARVGRIAAGLTRLGIERGDVVSVQLPNWWHLIAVHLACLRIGAVTNPLMPIFRERELSFMLRLAESKVVIIPKLFRDTDHEELIQRVRPSLPALRHVVVVGGKGPNSFEQVLLGGAAEALPLFAERRPSPDDVVQLLYTSGTTGEPKGVQHTTRTLMSNVLPSIDRLGLTKSDPIFCPTPLAHQLGFIIGVIAPIVLGSPAVLQDVWNPQVAPERIRENRVTFATGATPFLADLVEECTRNGGAGPLTGFLSAGAPIPRALVKRAREDAGFRVLSAYGMTENILVSATRPDDHEQKVYETDGYPTVGLQLRVVDEQGHELPSGTAGRLMTRGTSTFVGYLKRPELYNVDEDGWFETGDLARLDQDGYVTITGRLKDVVIRGGENIPVVEIENVLYRHPGVRQVAIVAMKDARLGERPCAFVVLKPGCSLAFTELRDFLKESGVARSYWPERLEIVETMPMTATGKIQKFVLRDMADRLSST